MSMLDSIIQWKNNQDQMAAQRGQAIAQTGQLIAAAKQNATQNQLQQLQIKAGLAQNALQLNPDGTISYNANYVNPNTQFQTLLGGQAAAKTAGNPGAYQMYSGLLNRVMGVGGSSSPAAVTASAVATPQVPQSAATGVQPTAISPNVASSSTPNVDQMLTLGQSSTTDPISGIVSTTQNQVNPAAQQTQSLAVNQATQVGLANNEAAQAQAQLDASKNSLGDMAKLHQDLVAGKAAGDPMAEFRYQNANAPMVGGMIENPQMAEKAATLKSMAQKYGEAGVQPDTATFGASGAKRIGNLVNTSSGDLGNLNSTAAQFNGTVKGELISGAQKSIGLQRYGNYLKQSGIDLNNQSDSQILAGINSQIGKITPQETEQINKMVNNTLGVKINPTIFTANAKAHGYSDSDIQKYLKANQ